MTNQEAFDKVWDTFITREQPYAINEHECCVYGGEGEGCAAACLMPPEVRDFARLNEGVGFLSLRARAMASKSHRVIEWFRHIEDLKFIDDLQTIHDESAAGELNLKDFAEALVNLGLRYKLEVPLR